jgi:hypothetical protein
MQAKHRPKTYVNDTTFRLECDQCERAFAREDSVFIPKVGIALEMQQSFRQKQAEIQAFFLSEAARLTRQEQQQSKLIRKQRAVKKEFGVPAPVPPKHFCTWECCKRYALRTCHKSMAYNMETLIHLTAGRVIDLDDC